MSFELQFLMKEENKSVPVYPDTSYGLCIKEPPLGNLSWASSTFWKTDWDEPN